MTARRLPPVLVALSPGELEPRACADFVRRAAAARRAGLSGLLLREPGLPERDWLALALELAALFHAGADGWFAVHDRAHLAAACAADALHLGYRSLPPTEVRGWLDAAIAIGLSTHAHDDLAGWVGADYLFHGPVLATPSKQGLLLPLGFEGLARGVRAAGATPVWGIGGLGPEQLAPALAAGAHGVAARAAVFGGDPTHRMESWVAALRRAGCGA